MNFLLIYVKKSLEKRPGNSSRKVIYSLTYGAGVTSVLCMNGRNKRLGHIDPVGSKGLNSQYQTKSKNDNMSPI